jgi:monofunctional glycosyltransferase
MLERWNEGRHRRGDRVPDKPRSVLGRLGRAALFCIGLFVIGSIFFVAVYREVRPPATPLMLLRLADGHSITKTWRPLDAMSPSLIRAVLAGEDAKFCRHRGFDWAAIEIAWRRYRGGRGPLLGASTISMQTAKNLFLWPGRDWLRKALEAYFTTLLELGWSKKRILEVYLNIVEWGPGIYGAEAASQHYFGKSAQALSVQEAARLAAVLPLPLDRSPRRPSRAVTTRAAFIQGQMPALPVRSPLPCGEPR